MNHRNVRVAALAFLACGASAAAQTPLGTGFTYQGQLKQNGDPANGDYAIQFKLFDAAVAGNQVGLTILPPDPVHVDRGLFTAQLDFGGTPFSGEARWLEIAVNGTPLGPRHPLTPAPYCVYTLQAQALMLPFFASAALPNPLIALTQSGPGSAASFEMVASPTLPLPPPSVPVLAVTNRVGGQAASIALVPDASNPDPTPWTPALQVVNRMGGVAASITREPNPDLSEPDPDPWVPALELRNISGGLAASLVTPDPDDVDGCPPPPCPLWDWLDAHVLEVNNQADGPAARFVATPEAGPVPAAQFLNMGLGQAVQARSQAPQPTIEGTNLGVGAAGSFSIPNPDGTDECVPPWPCPPWPWPFADSPALDVSNRARGPAARLYASTDMDTLPTMHVTNGGFGQAIEALNESGAPTIMSTNSSGGLAGLFNGDVCVSGKLGIGACLPQSAFQVADNCYVNTTLDFVSVNRSNRIGSEYFGVRAPVPDNAFGGMYMETSAAGGWPFYGYATNGSIRAYHYVNGTTGSWHLHNGGVRLTVQSDGLMGVGRDPAANRLEVEGNASKTTAGSWLANSDARIKSDVQPISEALELINKIRPVTFRYTDAYRAEHPSIEDRRYMNVIAQEIAEVFPEYVKSSGERLPGADSSDAGVEILQVDSYPLIIYSTAAVQELHAQMRTLQAENEELRTRLDDIERLLQHRAER